MNGVWERMQAPKTSKWQGTAGQGRVGLVETRLPGRDLKVPPIQTTNTGGGGGPVLWGQKSS